jgi:hypothetical protein
MEPAPYNWSEGEEYVMEFDVEIEIHRTVTTRVVAEDRQTALAMGVVRVATDPETVDSENSRIASAYVREIQAVAHAV